MPNTGSVNQIVPSDFTTTSFGELSRLPSKRSTRIRTEPSGSVREMVDHGVDTFLEVGPGQVLSGLIRRGKREARALSVGGLWVSLGANGSVGAAAAKIRND